MEAIEELAIHLADFSISEQDNSVLLRYFSFGLHRLKSYHVRFERHYKIFCVNGNTGFRNESRIFYFIHLQNEEAYERKESSSA